MDDPNRPLSTTAAWLPLALLVTLLGPGALPTAQAQAIIADPDMYDEPDGADEAEQAREVLRPKESDVDETELLENILDRTETEFSLPPSGSWELIWDFDYTYFDNARSDRLLTFSNETLGFTLLDIERDAEHAFINSITLDYGLTDNISAGIRVPVVFKYDSVQDEDNTDLGDIALRARWQPWPSVPGETRYTLFGLVEGPSGDSPYEGDASDLSTGSGFWSSSLGLNVSRVIDPVVAFGSINVTYNFDADDLDQDRIGPQGLPIELEEVDPGASVAVGAGLALALSYDVSLSFQYQLAYQDETSFRFDDGTERESEDQVVGIFTLNSGWRLDADTILNIGVGIGQTDESPDIILSATLPFVFEDFADLSAGGLLR
ncbi:MAG: transporter [Pseudomonadota bacterium]|nr:transporter [Pseudomonadota bacterium]